MHPIQAVGLAPVKRVERLIKRKEREDAKKELVGSFSRSWRFLRFYLLFSPASERVQD